MLIDRQLKIFTDLCRMKEGYLTANVLSQKHAVSVRTIQSDLSVIRGFVSNLDFLEFVSIPSRGSKIEVHEESKLDTFLDDLHQTYRSQYSSSKKDRVYKIIALLFNNKKSISVQHMADRLFVSKSTFLSDLKSVKTILKNYQIEVVNRAQTGLTIEGEEADIRMCIIKENIDMLFSYNEFMMMGQYSDNLPKIGDILVNILTVHKFRISDIALQNLIVHVDIMVRRIRFGFVLSHLDQAWEKQELANEMQLANEIFDECQRMFNVQIPQTEVVCLAIYLKGKSEYVDNSYITQEIDEFVLDTLKMIKHKFGLDFLDHVQLRISLSLHLVPLLMRLKYNMQLKNELLQGVHKSFQLAFDIATSFAYQIKQGYGYQLIADEIAYFAIYFNSALNTYQESSGTNNLLIITSLKRSETLLLRERINYWFSNMIAELNIIDRYEVTDDLLKKYTVVCTTVRNEYYENGSAILISQFPTDDDYRNIKMAMDGFKGKTDVLSLFQPSMLFVGKAKNKEEIIRILCDSVEACEKGDVSLREEVLRREAMGGTYFGNQVAMPHPMHPIHSKTYIAVGLLEEDVLWDNEDHRVRIVLLVCMEKDNPRAFQVWSYLSEFINNQTFIQTILEDMSYENFSKQLSLVLDNMNWKLRDY